MLMTRPPMSVRCGWVCLTEFLSCSYMAALKFPQVITEVTRSFLAL